MTQTPSSYHLATGYDRGAMEPHALDWGHMPDPYKSYPGLEGVALPEVGALFDQDLQAVYAAGGIEKAAAAPDLNCLSRICLLAAGLTARSRQGGRYFYYRSAPSAGALYPNELYLAAFGTSMLPAGIYHLGVPNRLLTRLRSGCFADRLRAAVPGLPADAAGLFMVSGIFFRSAWKYRKRAYRYVLLDAGHLAENLRLAIAASGYGQRLHPDFDDRALNHLLGLDERREGSLCAVSVAGGGAADSSPAAPVADLPQSVLAAGRVSGAEVVYPEITAIHEASKTVAKLDGPAPPVTTGLGISPSGGWVSLPEAEAQSASLNYADTVFRRRSKRNFVPSPLLAPQLAYLLDLLCRAAGPWPGPDTALAASVAVGFLAGDIDGLNSGFYLLDAPNRRMGRVFSGHRLQAMAAVCLDQAWLKNAAVHFVFMTNLEMLQAQWGPRGYRYAMLTAGRLGHAVYLGATALGLGCCGIGALYDGEARRLLGLNPDAALLYLVAAGRVR